MFDLRGIGELVGSQKKFDDFVFFCFEFDSSGGVCFGEFAKFGKKRLSFFGASFELETFDRRLDFS